MKLIVLLWEFIQDPAPIFWHMESIIPYLLKQFLSYQEIILILLFLHTQTNF